MLPLGSRVFADLTHPSTIAALLVDAALFAVALAAASGRLVRPVRGLARGLAVVAGPDTSRTAAQRQRDPAARSVVPRRCGRMPD
jgi:hypothetical protein